MAGILCLLVIMLLTVFDVLLRYLLNSPIKGTVEISEFVLVPAVIFGIAYTQNIKGHVDVDILFSYLPRSVQTSISLTSTILSLILFILISWQSLIFSILAWKEHEHSDLLSIPSAPFRFLVFIGTSLLCLQLVDDLIKNFLEMRRGKR